MGRIWKLLLMIITIILCDQFTKGIIQDRMVYGESFPVIDGLFNITYVKNPGAAFGLGANSDIMVRKVLFLYLPVLACFWLCALIWKSRYQSMRLALAYSLIFAGAFGNLMDRFSYGHVVDFLDFYWGDVHFPAFNVADSSISVAAGLLILDFFLSLKKNKKVNPSIEGAPLNL